MMDSGPVRNMLSILSNKFEKLCISLAFIVTIHHDARSPECQTSPVLEKTDYIFFFTSETLAIYREKRVLTGRLLYK